MYLIMIGDTYQARYLPRQCKFDKPLVLLVDLLSNKFWWVTTRTLLWKLITVVRPLTKTHNYVHIIISFLPIFLLTGIFYDLAGCPFFRIVCKRSYIFSLSVVVLYAFYCFLKIVVDSSYRNLLRFLDGLLIRVDVSTQNVTYLAVVYKCRRENFWWFLAY